MNLDQNDPHLHRVSLLEWVSDMENTLYLESTYVHYYLGSGYHTFHHHRNKNFHRNSQSRNEMSSILWLCQYKFVTDGSPGSECWWFRRRMFYNLVAASVVISTTYGTFASSVNEFHWVFLLWNHGEIIRNWQELKRWDPKNTQGKHIGS